MLCWFFLRCISFIAILPSRGCVFLLPDDVFFGFPPDKFNFKTCCATRPWCSVSCVTSSWINTPFCYFVGYFWMHQIYYLATTFPSLLAAKIKFGVYQNLRFFYCRQDPAILQPQHQVSVWFTNACMFSCRDFGPCWTNSSFLMSAFFFCYFS